MFDFTNESSNKKLFLDPMTGEPIGASGQSTQPTKSNQTQGNDNSETTTSVYTLKSGDTVGNIAAMYYVNSSEIVKLNGLTNPNLIVVGQQLTIPSGK